MFNQTALYEYAVRLKALKGKENTVFRLALDNRTIKDLIVFLNTEQQMGEESVDSFGQQIFNRLSRRTTYADNPYNRKKGRVDEDYRLIDTGKYWASFQANIGSGFIVIKSDPRKGNDNLEEQYGALEGLTDESLQALIKLAYEYFIQWYIRNLLPQ